MDQVKRDVSIYYNDGNKIHKLTDCRILHLDAAGVTFKDKAKLGKTRVKFIPHMKLVMIEQEFM
ncbi:MAG: hypothetical protein IH840_02290 [Candidatus Heimdallarchaeota archaeon]|nr:hypothetical protein [Candidatus Heimdallarchaeota archaeon]